MVFLVLAAVAPLTGVVVVAAMAIALGNGGGMVVSFLVVAAILLLFAVGYAQMSKKLVNAGGFYAFVVKGLGPVGGLVAGFIATMGYNFFVAGAIGTTGFFMQIIIADLFGLNVHWIIWGIAAMAVAFLFARRGIDFSAKVLGVALVLETLMLMIFDFAVLFQSGFTFDVFSPEIILTGSFGIGLLLASTGFLGFEATALFGEEAKSPLKTIPRATYIAITTIGLILAFTTWAIVSAIGAAQAQTVALEHLESGDLIFSLSEQYLGGFLTRTMMILLMVSLFAALLAFHNAATRYLFALGRARVLPKSLSVTAKNGVPLTGGIVNFVFAGAVAAAFAVSGMDPILTLVPTMIGFGTLCILVLQMLAALSIVVYFRREGDNRWLSTFVAPGIGFLGLLCIVAMAIWNFPLLAGSDALAVSLLPILLLLALIGAVIYGNYLRAKKPGTYAGLSNDLEKFEEVAPADIRN
ncbi:APC family permease [Paeniglutamicibacter cryotolerans]|uniref:Amino acid transporter n=1 Tax=Paeniglutamicibacter cryotolerans TaxID=670079 RepID=A0A839QI75_9MICC|nr:APC family permease [Paeniglutamicibacter cryotolerans]MBB2994444.1 amino acid transporter [Paeniglutamicibacter cryotolerans]